MDRAGQTLLGKYELTRMLGKGGMGEVWEGEHQLTGRRVAVKVLSQNYLTNRKVMARFGREARAASAVAHEGIVEILDQDKMDDGLPFLVMEFLDGESVGARIKAKRRLSQDEALAIMLPLLEALEAAHQAGVIHRDLKPDNVFIVPAERGEERIKILDFGISQKADEIDHNLTQEGSVLGTPHYMSPEQARGEAGVDVRADIYSAAVLCFECVVGDVPFDAGNYNALLQIILGTPPPSARSRGAKISSALDQVLLAAMNKSKLGRPPSASVFRTLLLEASMQQDDAVLDVESWTFRVDSEPPPELDFALGEEEDLFAPEPSPRESAGSGVRRALDFDVAPLRESGEFSFGSPLPAAPPAPAAPPGAVRRSPGGLSQGGFEAQSEPQLELAMPAAPKPVAAAVSAPRPLHPAAARPVRSAPQRRDGGTGEAPREGSGFVRALGRWLAVLVAIGALGYVANLVFSRPDPRKGRSAPASGAAIPASVGTTP